MKGWVGLVGWPAADGRDCFAEKKYSSKSGIVGNAVFFLNTMINEWSAIADIYTELSFNSIYVHRLYARGYYKIVIIIIIVIIIALLSPVQLWWDRGKSSRYL